MNMYGQRDAPKERFAVQGSDLDQRSHIELVLAVTFISDTFEEGL